MWRLFLENKEWTHLFWIDSDIGFSPEAALRLLQADYEIAAGVYPLKREEWPAEGLPAGMSQEAFQAKYQRYTVNARPLPGQESMHFTIQEDGFIEMSEAPTGFMLIKREVFEKMMAHYPELRYVPDSIGVSDQGLHYRFLMSWLIQRQSVICLKIMAFVVYGKTWAEKFMWMLSLI